jgi:Tol biopolymer transport system component
MRSAAFLAVAVLCLAGAQPAAATFPGTNGLIAFESTFRDGTDTDIFTIAPDATGLTNLTAANPTADRYPYWSADGTKLVFTSDRDGGDMDVFVMNADGTGQTQVTANAAEDFSASWSPDGVRIAFASDQGGEWNIWVVDADGGNLTQLTATADEDRTPAWSPDGTKIAFNRGPLRELWLMNPDGTGQTLVTSPSGHSDWAPDGSHLLFFESADIWRVNPDGTGLANVSNTPGIWEDPARYAPDMTLIVFPSNETDLAWDLNLANPDGTGRTPLAPLTGAFDFYPNWQPAPATRPGRGCGDKNRGHAREGDCKKLR